MKKYAYSMVGLTLTVMFIACSGKNPPRDEIPVIKDTLAEFQEALYDKNPVKIDSLLSSDAAQNNLDANGIISAIYGGGDSFYSFGQREFFYTRDRAVVKCTVMATQDDKGRPLEITLGKEKDRWLIRSLEFK